MADTLNDKIIDNLKATTFRLFFKKKAAKKSGDFIVHCMMDEIGRLHPNNIKGILQFANSRNIYLINSSPTSYNPYDYRYTYLLSKHGVRTRVEKLLKRIN